MLWFAEALLFYALFFYSLGRLHRADGVDPRLRLVFLAAVPGLIAATLTLSPVFLVWAKASFHQLEVSVSQANVTISEGPAPGVRGGASVVYQSAGDAVMSVLVLMSSLVPYAFYTAGRMGLPSRLRLRGLASAEAVVAGDVEARLELLEERVRELEEAVMGDGYAEAVRLLVGVDEAERALVVGD